VDGQWRLLQISSWESLAVRARRISSLSVVQALAQDNAMNFSAPDVPVVKNATFQKTIVGWDCAELVLTSGRSNDVTPRQFSLSSGEENKGDHVGVEVKTHQLSGHRDAVPRPKEGGGIAGSCIAT
jgi:hypothetical protein